MVKPPLPIPNPLGAVLPIPEPVELTDIVEALAADEADERRYQLEAATHVEDEGEVIRVSNEGSLS